MSISFSLLNGLSGQASNNLAMNVPSPIGLNLSTRRRQVENHCAARLGIFRARSMTEAAMLVAIKLLSSEVVVSVNDVCGKLRERRLPPIAPGAAEKFRALHYFPLFHAFS